ncbi:MAG TPA: thioredoxin [Acholeplasmataceae bacterium]|jgi:thioredoxin 1|nr:thioredoxin [Acholeplasmataceae bacterium]
MVKKITGEEFAKETAGTVLVDFYADWCGPCKMVSPIVDELSEENAEIGFKKVNVDDDPDLAMRYNVRSIPTLILFKDGVEVDRVIGFTPKQRLQAWLDSHK